jgi:hypothetical protein
MPVNKRDIIELSDLDLANDMSYREWSTSKSENEHDHVIEALCFGCACVERYDKQVTDIEASPSLCNHIDAFLEGKTYGNTDKIWGAEYHVNEELPSDHFIVLSKDRTRGAIVRHLVD